MTRAARSLLGALVCVTLVLAGCGEDLPTLTAPTTGQPTTPAVKPGGGSAVRTTGRGPQPPDRGVWLGAWVKPEFQTATGRASALTGFGEQTGAQMAIGHMFHDWTDRFPGPTQDAFLELGLLPMISWSGTDTRSVTSGVYDSIIRQRAQEIRDWGQPVLLRWRWEMDRPNLAASVHSPADYIAAWKHIRAIFTKAGADNAGWVWCPHVRGFVEAQRDAAAYYPGDDQVDWVCTDVYPGTDFATFTSQMDAFMSFARQHPRPVILGEFGVTAPGQPGQRAAWLREARQYIKTHPRIKAAVYFAQKQGKKPVYDSTFDADPEGLAAFRELATDPYFAAPVPTRDSTPGAAAPRAPTG